MITEHWCRHKSCSVGHHTHGSSAVIVVSFLKLSLCSFLAAFCFEDVPTQQKNGSLCFTSFRFRWRVLCKSLRVPRKYVGTFQAVDLGQHNSRLRKGSHGTESNVFFSYKKITCQKLAPSKCVYTNKFFQTQATTRHSPGMHTPQLEKNPKPDSFDDTQRAPMSISLM